MNDDRSFDRAVHDWLEAAAQHAPSGAVQDALRTVDTTRQVRALPAIWGFSLRSPSLRMAVAVAVLVVAAGAAILQFGQGPNTGGPPTPTPSPLTSPTPPWQTYTSPERGYTISFPGTWIATRPSEGDLDLPEFLFAGPNAAIADRFEPATSRYPNVIVAVPMLATTAEAWLAERTTALEEACNPGAPEQVTVAGAAAEVRKASCIPSTLQFDVAFVHDGEVVNIIWTSSGADEALDRATFDQILESFVWVQ